MSIRFCSWISLDFSIYIMEFKNTGASLIWNFGVLLKILMKIFSTQSSFSSSEKIWNRAFEFFHHCWFLSASFNSSSRKACSSFQILCVQIRSGVRMKLCSKVSMKCKIRSSKLTSFQIWERLLNLKMIEWASLFEIRFESPLDELTMHSSSSSLKSDP